jgi:integrase
MTPSNLLERYIANHEIGLAKSTIDCHYSPAVVLFQRATFCTDISTVNRDTFNKFVDWLKNQPIAPETKKSRRRGMLTLLAYAYDQGWCKDPLVRTRKISVPKRTPRAWSFAQVQHLVKTIDTMQNMRPVAGVPYCDWWSSLVMAAWDTGLRLGDLLSLTRDAIDEDGNVRKLQSKTQREHFVSTNKATMEVIARFTAKKSKTLIWNLDYPRRKFFSEFQRIMIAANLKGSFKFLRRSAVTFAESQQPGAGQRLADHQDSRTTRESYIDSTLIPRFPIVLKAIR